MAFIYEAKAVFILDKNGQVRQASIIDNCSVSSDSLKIFIENSVSSICAQKGHNNLLFVSNNQGIHSYEIQEDTWTVLFMVCM